MRNPQFPAPGKRSVFVPPIYWGHTAGIPGAMLTQDSRGRVTLTGENIPRMTAPARAAMGGSFPISDINDPSQFAQVIERIRAYDYSHNRR